MPDVNAETTAMPDADGETATLSAALHALDAAPSSVRELTRLKELGFSFTQEAETMCHEKEATAAAVRQELQSAAAASHVAGALVARLQTLETAVLRAKTSAEFVRIKKQVCVVFVHPPVSASPSSSVLHAEPDCDVSAHALPILRYHDTRRSSPTRPNACPYRHRAHQAHLPPLKLRWPSALGWCVGCSPMRASPSVLALTV